MIITAQTPTRISLFGGGTDVDPFASKYGGAVLNIAINLRQKVILQSIRLKDEGTVKDELLDNDNVEFIYSFLNSEIVGKNKIIHEFDGPIESGLGSSASLATALIGARNKYLGIDMTKEDISEEAWDTEVNSLGLYGGKQDQYCSVYGGINFMEFGKKVKVWQLPRSTGWIIPHLCLFYTGRNRQSGKIQDGYKKLSPEQIKTLKRMKAVAYQGLEALYSKDIKRISELLNEAWELKKKSNGGVSNEFIDKIYDTALKNGATAGKIMGAGGGGHILFVCPPEKQDTLKNALTATGCSWVDFSADWNGLETRTL